MRGWHRTGRAVLAATLVLASAPVAATQTHGLILTIRDYQPEPLEGVERDAEYAREIARLMGVPPENIVHRRDRELTLAGLRRAFAEFARRVQPGDQAFIYYSGHGGRLPDPRSKDRCIESLVAVDQGHYSTTELEAQLKALAAKADKVIVFVDACHSGGAKIRRAEANERRAPKPIAKTMPDPRVLACANPVNDLTFMLRLGLRGVDNRRNIVYVAAAEHNEVSVTFPGQGSTATRAWLECLRDAKADTDGSAGLTAEELRQCAQPLIDTEMAQVAEFLPHHITVSGNEKLVLALTTPNTRANPQATLRDIYHHRDAARALEVKLSAPTLRIGRDPLEFSVKSDRAGYVYVLFVGSDGTSFDLLFPNELDQDNVIRAGQTLMLPRPAWEVVAQGPPGKNQLLVLVADAPRDFARLDMRPAGPFSLAPATPATARHIHYAATVSAAAGTDACRGEKSRNLAVRQGCSNAYAAELLTVEERP